MVSMIVRWSLGKTNRSGGGRKEPYTRATLRGSRSCVRHRSALTTVRLHNRQWRGEHSTPPAVVNAFSSRASAFALRAASGTWEATEVSCSSESSCGMMDRTRGRALKAS